MDRINVREARQRRAALGGCVIHLYGAIVRYSMRDGGAGPRGERPAWGAERKHRSVRSVPVWVIPTDEERMIAQDTRRLIDTLVRTRSE